MTPEEHRMLVEIRDMVIENNKAVKSLERTNRVGIALKAVYWLVILGASFGAYYFIQPYVDMLKGSITQVEQNPGKVADAFTISGTIQGVKDLLGE